MTLNQEYNYDSRLKAAKDLVKLHQERFSAISTDRWTYQGSKGETYEINTEIQTCTCADHIFRCMGQSDKPCKHLIAVSILQEYIKNLIHKVIESN